MNAGPVTLSDLIGAGKLLWCYRTACGHERNLNKHQRRLRAPSPHLTQTLEGEPCEMICLDQ